MPEPLAFCGSLYYCYFESDAAEHGRGTRGGRLVAVIGNIQRQYGEMFSAEKRVADFILQHPNQLIEQNYSISELSGKCGASEASIIRMCKRIGYSGFSQLKITLAQELEISDIEASEAAVHDTPYDVVSYIDLLTKELQFCSKNIDTKKIMECVDLIVGADAVETMAWGNTNTIAADFATRLSWYRINVFNSEISDYAIRHLDIMTDKSVLIAISHSGNAFLVIEALKLAHKRGIKTILITNTLKSPSSDFADYLLCTNSTGFANNKYASESHIMEMVTIDILLYFIQKKLKTYEQVGDAEMLVAQFHRYFYLLSK